MKEGNAALNVTAVRDVANGIIDTLDRRPIAERLEIVFRLITSLEEKYQALLEQYRELTERHAGRGDPWGYL